MSLDIQIGEKLRVARRRTGLSISDIARILSVTEDEVAAYEAGTRRICADKLYQSAQAFDVDLRWFFDQSTADDELWVERSAGQNTNSDRNTSILSNMRANKNLTKLCEAVRESDYILLNRSKVA